MQSRHNANHLIVLTTLDNAVNARILVRRLVEKRLVACGTVVDKVDSIYWWKGKLEEAAETLVILKTRRERWDGLQSAVRRWHPYDVPELLALPVDAGLEDYLAWLDRETAPVDRDAV